MEPPDQCPLSTASPVTGTCRVGVKLLIGGQVMTLYGKDMKMY